MPQEYQDYLNENLNVAERVTQAFSALDERVDYTNYLLTELLKALGGNNGEGNLELADAIQALVNALGGQLDNPDTFRVGTDTADAVMSGQNLPDVKVPFDMEIVVKAYRSNTDSVYVATTRSDSEGGVDTAYPLWAGEAVGLKLSNVDKIWWAAEVAGEGISWVVEQSSPWLNKSGGSRY
jgi:hypothetical protein